jgi:hypothetical protein
MHHAEGSSWPQLMVLSCQGGGGWDQTTRLFNLTMNAACWSATGGLCVAGACCCIDSADGSNSQLLCGREVGRPPPGAEVSCDGCDSRHQGGSTWPPARLVIISAILFGQGVGYSMAGAFVMLCVLLCSLLCVLLCSWCGEGGGVDVPGILQHAFLLEPLLGLNHVGSLCQKCWWL